jgi:ubiquinone/menaquinone biosynthesis C-methylase UbiE
MRFRNVYQDRQRADAYATLEFERTYHLAFRELPDLLARHARGNRALDFGCGSGRWAWGAETRISPRHLHVLRRCGSASGETLQ